MTNWKEADLKEIEYLKGLPKVLDIHPKVKENLGEYFSSKPPLKNYQFELISDVRCHDKDSGYLIPYFRLDTVPKKGRNRKASCNYLIIEFHRLYPYGRGYGRADWNDDAYDQYTVYYEVAFPGQSLLSRLFKIMEKIKVNYKVLSLRDMVDDTLIDDVTHLCIEIIEANSRLLDSN